MIAKAEESRILEVSIMPHLPPLNPKPYLDLLNARARRVPGDQGSLQEALLQEIQAGQSLRYERA